MSALMQCTVVPVINNAVSNLKKKFDTVVAECDGWFLVLMAVLLVLAFTVVGALAIWCTVYKGKTFTGNWKWYKWGVEIKTECV